MSEPRHTNRLIDETSPYLLQHAHNPVDWYAWSDEALARAKTEGKPILLSVGYSACHWCHVMEHESFENDEIARLMNERFISIKVDREERPDLDHIYQSVCQMLTGTGGWPLTMFLTPDLDPFWGGTYFPPEDRYGRPGFQRILEAISDHYHSQPDRVREATAEIGRALRELNSAGSRTGSLAPDLLQKGAEILAQAFDQRNGGFGSQPKFPNSMSLEVMLRHWKNSGDEEYLRMVRLALRKMAEGGIYDQLGGGFHRYSTDSQWLVPHFEKMLYDNALLTRLYTQTFQATGDPLLARTVRETLDYVTREMTSPEGGFYSTQDADSEGEEGKFFVWTPDEIREVIGDRDAILFCQYYGVTRRGNFEHQTSILSVVESPARLAADYGLSAQEVESILFKARMKLFETREQRIKPFRDDKVLTGWNGLMISAFAEAARVLVEPGYLSTALGAARFVRDHLYANGRLLRTWRCGQARGDGFLDDYAFLVAGLLDVYLASGEIEWLELASSLSDTMIELFRDPESGDLFMTPPEGEHLIVRPRQSHDQSIPSGVSVAAFDLLRLSSLLQRPELQEIAGELFMAHADDMAGNPHGGGNLLCAYDYYLHGPAEVVILRNPARGEDMEGINRLLLQYLPNTLVLTAALDAGEPPLARGKQSVDGKMTAYVCRNFTCSAPVTSWEELENLVE